jgi:FtsP/CotA-like multicopper oxidase with cupredoxin domain
MLSHRALLKLGKDMALSASLPEAARTLVDPNYSIDIAPFLLEISPQHIGNTIAYNRQVPGQILRFTEGHSVTIDVTNHTSREEVIHWHGLLMPSDVDGAMERARRWSPQEPAHGIRSRRVRVAFAGITPTRAGDNLTVGQYTGQHGFLMIEPRANASGYYQEFFLALHDWDGQMLSGGDGSMNPAYKFPTINW